MNDSERSEDNKDLLDSAYVSRKKTFNLSINSGNKITPSAKETGAARSVTLSHIHPSTASQEREE